MDWKEYVGKKLTTAEEAAKLVKSGDDVRIELNSIWNTPWGFSMALAKRAPQLENVRVDITWTLASEAGLLAPGTEKAFKTFSCFSYGPTENAKFNTRDEQANYIPMQPTLLPLAYGPHRDDFRKRWIESDVMVTTVSPPTKVGYVTFGNHLWYARDHVRNAKIAIGEVREDMPIIPGGDNWMPVEAFDYFIEAPPPFFDIYGATTGLSETPPEEQGPSEVICAVIANELVDDGDCIMFGGGAIPMRVGPFLENKVDLGCHTEVIVPLDLVRRGVINGKRRNLCPGKTSCTAVGAIVKEDEAFIDGNPHFDIRDMGLNNSTIYCAQNDNMVAINAPLEITLMGDIGIERVGYRYYRGLGGQVEMLMGALMAKNGRSIHGTVSRKWSDTRKEWVSAIVPQFTYPGRTSISSQLADFIVTEYGIASLQGKTERERAEELIAIAHPDYREELRKEARKMLYP